MGRKLTDANRLSLTFPELAKEWHPTMNGDLTPAAVSKGSGKKVWWRCEKFHDWEAPPDHRSRGNGCPYCSGKYVSDLNRLSIRYPDVAKEWHPIKNGDVTSDDVSYGSNKRVWWRCERRHEWDAVISSRTLDGVGCPYCAGQRATDENRLSIRYPNVAAQWHPDKNGNLTSADFACFSNKMAWWLCEKGHEWNAKISMRSRGNGCPYCSGYLVTDENRLSILYPDVAKQWHPTKNDDLIPYDVTYATHWKAWWLCERGHEWDAVVSSRTKDGVGCPYCAGKLVTDENRLSIHYPEVAKQWHPTQNGDLTPDDVSYGSDKKAWWLCEKGHEWEATIGTRCNKGSGCLFCSRKLVSDLNRLSIHYPAVAKQWHPTKNGDITPDDVMYASNKRAWWRCARGHEWNAKISERTRGRGRGCARCSIPHRSKVEIYLACELAAFFDDIDPAQTHAIRTPQGETLNVDILIPSENMVIEYDALYWHKVRLAQDTNKTSALKAAGWNVLRIRESHLPLIQPTDLQCEVTFIDDAAQLKRLANKTLAHLKETFGIHIPGLDKYLMSDSLTNEAAANAIIGKAAAQQLTLFAIDA